VGGQPVGIHLLGHLDRSEHVLTADEQMRKARGEWIYASTYDYKPAAALALEITKPWDAVGRSRWSDSKKPLEDQLGQVVLGIEHAAVLWVDFDRRRLAEQEAAQREKRRQEVEQRREEHRQALQADLRKMADRWQQAMRIQDFLDAVARTVALEDRDGKFSAWFAWAQNCAATLDPLSAPRDIAHLMAFHP
jgi:hypothetical protein